MRRTLSRPAPDSRSEAALLQRGTRAAPPLAAPRFSRDFSSVPIRAKLKVGAAGDAFEREADRIADQVMKTPESRVQRKCACGGGGGSCDDCSSKEDEPEPAAAERRLPGGRYAGFQPAGRQDAGAPLDATTRAFMEPRFGRDFTRVRIHTGNEAAESAASLQARAYTLGHDIVFGAGEYRPHTAEGRHLLAHELTHVTQQHGDAVIRRKTAAESPTLEFQEAKNKPPCACLLFIHEDESTAREMAGLMYEHCNYNFTKITNQEANERRIKIGSGSKDPNELFPRNVAEECWHDDAPCQSFVDQNAGATKRAVIIEYMQRKFFLEIKHCSDGFKLPILGLHNNSIADTRKYQAGLPSQTARDALRGTTFEKPPAGGGKLSQGAKPFAELEKWLLDNVKTVKPKTKTDPKNPQLTVSTPTAKGEQDILTPQKTNIFLWCTLPENSMCHIADPDHLDNVTWVTNRDDFAKLAATKKVNVALQTGDFDTDLSTLFVKLPKISEEFEQFRTKLEADVPVQANAVATMYANLWPLLKTEGILSPNLWSQLAGALFPTLQLLGNWSKLTKARGVTLIDPKKLHFTNIETPEEFTPDKREATFQAVKTTITALGHSDCCDAAASAKVIAGMRASATKKDPKPKKE